MAPRLNFQLEEGELDTLVTSDGASRDVLGAKMFVAMDDGRLWLEVRVCLGKTDERVGLGSRVTLEVDDSRRPWERFFAKLRSGEGALKLRVDGLVLRGLVGEVERSMTCGAFSG